MLEDNNPDKKSEYGFESNPMGTWNTLQDCNLKTHILQEAREFHAAFLQGNSEQVDLKTFVDLFTAQWLEFKAKVEQEALSYGFRSCKDLSEVSPEDRRNIALLALSRNGSFFLLGNGCLTPRGASGRYERIPYRTGKVGNRNAPRGVICTAEPRVGEGLHTSIMSTSPIYLLYYTTDRLPKADRLQMGETLSRLQHETATRTNESMVGTMVDVPRRKRVMPQEVPIEIEARIRQ